MTDRNTDYDVGYGKPPKATQFKKGRSGNPKGRPKGALGLKTDLKAELNEKVTINENGKPRKLRKQQLLVKQLTNKALKGDIRAITKLADLTLSLLGPEDQIPTSERTLSEEDADLLRAYVARQTKGPSNDQCF